MKKILFIILCLLWSVPVFALPSVTSTTGTMTNGQTITVAGSGFGAVASSATYWNTFDGYSADWSCNAVDGSCSEIPDPSFGTMAWKKSVFGPGSDEYMMLVNGNPLYNVNDDDTQYSTGRAWNEWPEANHCSAGGLPNGSADWDLPGSPTEIFYVYYTKWASDWPVPYTPTEDKNVEFWSTNSSKYTGGWRAEGSPTTYRLGTEEGGADLDLNCTGYPMMNWNNWSPPNDSSWPGAGKWLEMKVHLRMNTVGSNNGVLQVWQNGTKVIDCSGVRFRNSSIYFAYVSMRCNWSCATGTNIPSGQERLITYDDTMANLSSSDPTGGHFPGIAAVYISNQSTWGTGPTDKLNGDANFVRQKVGGTATADLGFKSWTDTGLKFELASYSSSFKYLYVWSWNGDVNTTGYSLDGIPPSAQGCTISGGTFR